MPGSRRFPEPTPAIAGALVALLCACAIPAPAQTAGDQESAPSFRLEQNFPNPFTPGVSPTIFTYAIDARAPVRLTIYNLLAQEIAILVDETQERGLHRVAWDGTDAKGERVPAGVYWYKLEVGSAKPALRRLRVSDVADPSTETFPVSSFEVLARL